MSKKNLHLNPYIAGALIGLVMLLFYVIVGVEFNVITSFLEVVGGGYSAISPDLVANNEFFEGLDISPVSSKVSYAFILVLGIFAGGFISSLANKRLTLVVEGSSSFSWLIRLLLVALGGIVVGFSTQLGRGDLLDNVLGGSVFLSTGSVIFVIMALLSSYVFAFLFWRQWSD